MHQKTFKGDGKLCPKCQQEKDFEETKLTEMTKNDAEQVIKTPDF
jgi:hypothetical protein